MIGETLVHHRVLGLLDAGGIGAVYRTEVEAPGDTVAPEPCEETLRGVTR